MISMVRDEYRPLSSHTKLDYDECYAKLVLEKLFPNRYSNLLLADKPDLQGDNIGIEVTIANDRKMQEATSNWANACNSTDEETKRYYIERMEQLGVKYTGGVQGWPGIKPSFELTKDAVETKIKKLKKGNYKFFKRYELYVFTDTWFHEIIVEDAKRFLFSNEVSDCFKTVYALSECHDLHVFETDIGKYLHYILENPFQFDLAMLARQMVRDAEK